jgi:CRISPR system Cascade subunit CasA
MTDEKGSTEKVSLLQVFQNAHDYKRLAGDTPAQDFSILRLLLAVMHTVFSRFDFNGDPYKWLELDERYIQINDILDEDDEEDYTEAIKETWKSMWISENLPNVIRKYLRAWQDRFYFFDDTYPFYQVTEKDLLDNKILKTGEISLKLINRLISESNNKIELFSPASEDFKALLSDGSLVRWIIAFQAYTGTGDKAKFPGMKASASKGWLLGLGGVYLQGSNLKETLLLNMNLLPEPTIQTPIWEKEISDKINDLLNKQPNNLSELYTNCSRLLTIRKDENDAKGIIVKAVQLPGINPREMFLEPMTLWRYPKSGNDKDHFVPRPHNVNQSFWRSFGLLSEKTDTSGFHKRPGIIDWHNTLVDEGFLRNHSITVAAVGLSYNRDASTMPNNDIYDEINIADEVLADVKEKGWVPTISLEIEKTKTTIEDVLKNLVLDISLIRNIPNSGLVDSVVQGAYFAVDLPFREWLEGISPTDIKSTKVKEWRLSLKHIILEQADRLLDSAGKRDFLGTMIKTKHSEQIYLNIEIAYAKFLKNLNAKLS